MDPVFLRFSTFLGIQYIKYPTDLSEGLRTYIYTYGYRYRLLPMPTTRTFYTLSTFANWEEGKKNPIHLSLKVLDCSGAFISFSIQSL